MSKWGRAAFLEAGGQPRSRLGRRSLVCALLAFAVAAAALIFFSLVADGAPELVKDIATVGFLVLFLVVAPAIHIFGVFCGLTALFRAGDSKVLAISGILLNVMSFMIGAGIVYAALRGMAAFT